MVINNSGNINPLIPQTSVDLNANKNSAARNPQGTPQGGVLIDQVEISRKAKELSKALVAINQMDDVRQNRVDKAVERIFVNNAKTPASVLAAKLLLED